MQQNQQNSSHHLWAIALWLTMVTIVYNVGEGVVSIIFGYADETLSLYGFGLDSLVEVVSGKGVKRSKKQRGKCATVHRDERGTAMKIIVNSCMQVNQFL